MNTGISKPPMRIHNSFSFFVLLMCCVILSTLLDRVSSADSPSISNTNYMVARNMPAGFDLAPHSVKISPGMVTAGDQLSSMEYLVHNYSNTSWSGTVHVKVYIFEYGKSVTSGTEIQNHSFVGNFSPKSTQRITVQNPVIIPPNIPQGSYRIGVFLDILDSNTSNNTSEAMAATDIWVDAETVIPTIQITTPTSNPTHLTDQAAINVSGTASDNVGVTEVTWVNRRTGVTGTASGTNSWAANGISLNKGGNVISVTAKDAAGNNGTAMLTVTYTPLDIDPPDTIITASPDHIITGNSATFTFTGSDNETQTSSLLYATYLQGYDTDWSAFSSSTSVTYNNLRDGSYTFHVRAKDQAGNIDPSPAAKSFTVAVNVCSYSVSSAGNNTFGPGDGSGVVSVTAPIGCSWAASVNERGRSWIRINSGSTGSGNGTVNYKVSANNTGNTRTGTLSIAGQVFTVTQLGSQAHRTSTAFFKTNENEEVKLPLTWTDEGNRYPLNVQGHSRQFINHPLKFGEHYPISFSFESRGDVEIEVTGSSQMCIGLYSAANGSLLSYSSGLGNPKTMIQCPVSENMVYHLVITPCISKVDSWTFSINGPSSFGEELHLNYDFKGSLQGTVNNIYGRRFYSVTVPPNAGRRLIATLLPEQNFNGVLRLFDDKGGTLIPSANTPSEGAINILTYEGAIPGRTYFICVEGNSANQHQGIGSYELRVEFIK